MRSTPSPDKVKLVLAHLLIWQPWHPTRPQTVCIIFLLLEEDPLWCSVRQRAAWRADRGRPLAQSQHAAKTIPPPGYITTNYPLQWPAGLTPLSTSAAAKFIPPHHQLISRFPVMPRYLLEWAASSFLCLDTTRTNVNVLLVCPRWYNTTLYGKDLINM